MKNYCLLDEKIRKVEQTVSQVFSAVTDDFLFHLLSFLFPIFPLLPSLLFLFKPSFLKKLSIKNLSKFGFFREPT